MPFTLKPLSYHSTNVNERGPLIPWYSTAIINSATLPGGSKLGQVWTVPGDLYPDAGGNSFMWVQARAALTVGQRVAYQVNVPATGTVTAAGSTTSIVKTNLTTTVSEVGNFIWFENGGGAGTGILKAIKAQVDPANFLTTGYTGVNTAFVVSKVDPFIATKPADPDVLAAVPTNGTNVYIVRPWSVIVGTATTGTVGIALGTVTSGNFTPVQVAGLANVLANGNGTAIVAGVPAAPDAAGAILGNAAANQYLPGGTILPYVATALAATLIPCNVNFIGAV